MPSTVRTVAAALIGVAGLLAGPATVGTATAAPRTATAADEVRVATYNIAKSTVGKGRFSWANRRVALVNNVRAVKPDVLLVQEANTQMWRGVRHIDDVQRLLASVGYQIASTNYETCTIGCTRGAHVFFNPARMRVATLPNPAVAVGMTGNSVIAGMGVGGIQDRAVSWAFLTPVGSTRTSLYVSVHMPTQKTASAEQLRVALARNLRPWATRLIAASQLPDVQLVIGGDFNSYARRQPYGAQAVLSAAGMYDGFVAPVRVNANYGTVNTTPKTKKYKGFPPRPYFYKANTTRIDYVFSSVPPRRHEVVLTLLPNGKFDNAYRASDHNMVLVDLPLR